MPNKAGSDNFVLGVRLGFTEKVAYDRVLRDEWIGLVINRENISGRGNHLYKGMEE